MNVDDRPTATRQFVAHPPFWGSKLASVTTPAHERRPAMMFLIYGAASVAFTAGLIGSFVGLQALVEGGSEWVRRAAQYGFQGALLLLLFGGVYLWTWRSRRRRIVLSVSSDAVTVSTRPGDVYPLRGARLGTWGVTGGMTMGTALHLQCGPRRFVLGGRDRRMAAGAPLDAPDAGYGLEVDVDAWLDASDFEHVLALLGRQGRDVRPPAADQPMRCLLFPNALKIQELSPWATKARRELYESAKRPRLAIEVGAEAIRVFDQYGGALLCSAWPTQVTATPVLYRPASNHLIPTVGNVISDYAATTWSTTIGMRVAFPGMPLLTIGCADTATGLDRRFAWASDVPVEDARADYLVSGADWMTLTAGFGLAPHVRR